MVSRRPISSASTPIGSAAIPNPLNDSIIKSIDGSLNTGFTLDLGLKDLGFVTALAREHGATLPVAELAERLFDDARASYGGDAWTPHVVRRLEEAAGVSLRADGVRGVLDRGAGDGTPPDC